MARSLFSFFAGALGALLVASAAAAQTGVYVDFIDFAGSPSSTFGAAAGPSNGGTWNAVDPTGSASGVFTTGPLMDSTGALSTMELTCDGQGLVPISSNFDEPSTFGDDAALLDDFIFYVGPAIFTFTNVPAGDYLVYTYAMAPDDPTFETSVEVVGSPDPLQVVGGSFAGGYALGTTHALHTVSVGPAGTIEVLTEAFAVIDSIAGIQIVPASGPFAIGSNYCSAQPNSTGAAASISAFGSPVASLNDVTLAASDVPPQQFGIFVTSMAQASTPVASGTLCVGGQISRLQGLGQILQADANGEFSLQIDTTAIPVGTGVVAIQAGETWNFTAWFRDVGPAGNTANFSDGVEIPFQ